MKLAKKIVGWVGIVIFFLFMSVSVMEEARLRKQCYAKGGTQLRMLKCVKVVEPARPVTEEIIELE